MTRSAAIVTLGCKTNQFESAAMSEALIGAGYQVCAFEEGAELVIVNTCTVTAATDSQSRNLIRRARRLNPDTRIIVTGCYAQIDPDALSSLPGVTLVIGNNEKKNLITLLTDSSEGEERIHVSDISRVTAVDPLEINAFTQRSRAFVQIQNGCNAFCSYCIIPYARGRSRSVPIDAVLTQIETLSVSGYREVVLTGIHIGQYGLDFNDGTSLLTLLERIRTSAFNGRLRLGSIEPTEISPEFYQYVLSQEWICPHFHIPLQAGHDDILKRMNRHYSVESYNNLLTGIRSYAPNAAIGLDIISGFPGETDEHFQQTIDLLEALPFSHLHVFPFSRRTGTPAATMPDQVPGDIVKERARILRELGEKKNRLFMEQFKGQKVGVVLEGELSQGVRRGLSEHYLPVSVSTTEEKGALIDVLVKDFNQDSLLGDPYENH